MTKNRQYGDRLVNTGVSRCHVGRGELDLAPRLNEDHTTSVSTTNQETETFWRSGIRNHWSPENQWRLFRQPLIDLRPLLLREKSSDTVARGTGEVLSRHDRKIRESRPPGVDVQAGDAGDFALEPVIHSPLLNPSCTRRRRDDRAAPTSIGSSVTLIASGAGAASTPCAIRFRAYSLRARARKMQPLGRHHQPVVETARTAIPHG